MSIKVNIHDYNLGALEAASHPNPVFTHRAVGFIRGRASENSWVELKLAKVGRYWVSHLKHVYLDNPVDVTYPHLPLVVDGKVLNRGDSGLFDYPELCTSSIKEGVDEARVYSRDEAARHLLRRFVGLRDYWATITPPSGFMPTTERDAVMVKERLDGFLFSILTMLDGESPPIPRYYLIPRSTQEDIDFQIKWGDGYYPLYDPKEDPPQVLPPYLRELYSPFRPINNPV